MYIPYNATWCGDDELITKIILVYFMSPPLRKLFILSDWYFALQVHPNASNTNYALHTSNILNFV